MKLKGPSGASIILITTLTVALAVAYAVKYRKDKGDQSIETDSIRQTE